MSDNTDNIFYTIKDSLINKEIVINDDYDADVKLKLYLLKYRILIGLILLILLIVLGYYYNPYENLFNSNSNDSQVQRGGAETPTPSIETAALETPATPSRTRRALIRQGRTTIETLAKVGRPIKKAGKKSLETAKDVYNDPKKYLNKGFDFGAAAAHKIGDNSDLIYQILYSVALFIVICIVAIPSVGFLIIGIVCYFLLKDKMKTIKGL